MSTQILDYLLQQASMIEHWLENQWIKTPPPLYCSVDLRYCGFKLAPVDTNLFPAGFNLLPKEAYHIYAKAFQHYFNALKMSTDSILLIPENHTRNVGYLENIATLIEILTLANKQVRIGTLIEDIKQPKALSLPSGQTLTFFPIQKDQSRLTTENFDPDLILLNHDLSGEIPSLLENIDQPILPPLSAGWSTRLKSQHFQHYADVVEEFSQLIAIDPWLLSPLFDACGGIDFISHDGENHIASKSKALFSRIQSKYQAYCISEPPFLMVKSDSGTYGMGIMTLHDPQDIYSLNRKERSRMASGKGGVEIDRVLIQEGIYTTEKEIDNKGMAEAVIYMIGKEVVGGFYRLHPNRASDENLNTPGMYFDHQRFNNLSKTNPSLLYAYQVVARLALVAAAREINIGN